MKTLIENWNKFIQTEEIDVPADVEQSDTEAAKTIERAATEGDSVVNKVTSASKDSDVIRQSLEAIINKLVAAYAKVGR